jgi:hypothetical protein
LKISDIANSAVSVDDTLANRQDCMGSGWHMAQLNQEELELRARLEAMSDFEILAVMGEI